MVLSNASSKSRNIGSLITRPQGGGSKKAGAYPSNGHGYMYPHYLNNTNPVNGHCATLSCLMTNVVFNVCQSRPVGVRPSNYMLKCVRK